MRQIFALVIAGALLATMTVGTASAAPMKRYPNCAALLKAYPAGVAKDKRSAAAAVKDGQRRPAVRPKVYRDNAALDRDKDGTACEQPSPKSQRAVIRTTFGFVVVPYVKAPAPGQCTDIPVTYDIRNPDRVPGIGMFFEITDDFGNNLGGTSVLSPAQSGAIRVCAEDWPVPQSSRTYRAAKPGVYTLKADRITITVAGIVREGSTPYTIQPR